jgi:hypothetical protein
MPYVQYTTTQVVAQLAARYEGAAFWTAAEALRAINLSLRTWNSLTGVWRTSVTVSAPPASEDHLVPLPGSLMYRTRVTIAGRPLTPISRFELNRIRPNWVNEYTDSGGGIPTQIDWWAPAGLYIIRIWPGNRVATDLLVGGVSATPVLVNPGDFINIGEDDLGPILDEALHILTFKQGGLRFTVSIPLHQAMLREAADRNAILAMNEKFRQFMGLDRNRSYRPGHAPEGAPSIAGIASLTRPEGS